MTTSLSPVTMAGSQLTISILLLVLQLSSSQDFNVETEPPSTDTTLLEVASNTTVVPINPSDPESAGSTDPEAADSTDAPETQSVAAVDAAEAVDSAVVVTNNQTNNDNKNTTVAPDVVENNNGTTQNDTNIGTAIETDSDSEEGSGVHENEVSSVEVTETEAQIDNATDKVMHDMEESVNATNEDISNTTQPIDDIDTDLTNSTELVNNTTNQEATDAPDEEGTGMVSDGWTHSEDDGFSPQTQLYIVAGTLGGVVFLLILLVLALALSVSRIKDQLATRGRYSPDTGGRNGKGGEIFAYENGAYTNNSGGDMQERRIDGHEDLEKMGYSVYNGRQDNRENVYKVNDPHNGGDPKDGENIPMDNIRYSSPSAAERERPVMRYEEGVIPLNEVRGSQRRTAPSRYH